MNAITKITKITKASLMVATLALVGIVSGTAVAQDCERPDHAAVERTVELTDTGVVMTLVGADADAIAAIQERAAEHDEREPRGPEGVVSETEFTDTGVQITLSSSDPEVVAQIQEHAEREPGERGGRGRGHRGPRTAE